MEKSKTATSQKDQKNTSKGNNTNTKSKKGGVTSVDTSRGATSKVRSKVGHGMANEGTAGTYEEGDR